MNIANYGRIGKGILKQALGLQANYKVIEYTSRLDESESGCFSCPIYKLKQDYEMLGVQEVVHILDNECSSCSHAKYYQVENKISYINEKNRCSLLYGYKERLKGNAIKLFLLYHLMYVDNLGFIKYVDGNQLANLLNVDIKTIVNNNKILENYGYIQITPSGFSDNTFTVFLKDYKHYHKKAREGGTGYLKLSKTLFEEICNIKTINELRISLRFLLESDTHKKDDAIKSTYKELRHYLPDYCKKHIIRNVLNKGSTIYNTTLNEENIEIKIFEEYNVKYVLEQEIEHNLVKIVNHIDKLNVAFEKYNTATVEDEKAELHSQLSVLKINQAPKIYPALKINEMDTTSMIAMNLKFSDLIDKYPTLTLNARDFNSLAMMCTTYSYDIIIDALTYVYNNYLLRYKPIYNMGGLIRTIILSNKNSNFAA